MPAPSADDDEASGSGCGNPAKGPVLDGVDMVDLFHSPTKNPVKGSAQFNDTSLGGYRFHFINADNLAEFRANATKYAPALGGY